MKNDTDPVTGNPITVQDRLGNDSGFFVPIATFPKGIDKAPNDATKLRGIPTIEVKKILALAKAKGVAAKIKIPAQPPAITPPQASGTFSLAVYDVSKLPEADGASISLSCVEATPVGPGQTDFVAV